ncbi:MAG: GntR family transcriptional regulator [Clostridia bacterium]|nr:GntR family transcriptional regulator [Clostridia bacterium]
MSVLHPPFQVKTKTEMIYSTLREAIVSGDLKPGERIVLRKVASDLGVSAIPVREAVKLLEAEGLLEVSAHSEVVVSKLSETDFKQLSDIRIMLEGYATLLATKNADEEFVKDLESQMAKMRTAIEKQDFRQYSKLNIIFHQTIYQKSGNEHLKKIIDDLTAKTERARALFISTPQRYTKSIEDHVAIIKAIADGDGERAQKLMCQHQSEGIEIFLKNFKFAEEDKQYNLAE